ncbi:hypothetical protein EV360DRAFT_91057 [Lentinula raphanica]|nr:hypothetical protein EV360DRAFT_91057 [Lentinula raphanica]
MSRHSLDHLVLSASVGLCSSYTRGILAGHSYLRPVAPQASSNTAPKILHPLPPTVRFQRPFDPSAHPGEVIDPTVMTMASLRSDRHWPRTSHPLGTSPQVPSTDPKTLLHTDIDRPSWELTLPPP